MAKVSVIGTTSWGTTLAILLAQNGANVALWARTHDEAAALESAHENRRLLPGFAFPVNMHATASLEEALDALEADHEFLLKGDVFTEDVIQTWLEYKREQECREVALRPHPHEFELYYDM